MPSEPPSRSSEADALHHTDADLFLQLQNGQTDTLGILYLTFRSPTDEIREKSPKTRILS